MKMHDCDACQSAGSVNRWGVCEICGESMAVAVVPANLLQLPGDDRMSCQLKVAELAPDADGKSLVATG